MNQRTHYQMIISCADMQYETAKAFLAKKLGAQFAGATFSRIDGAWSSQGSEDRSLYQDIMVEQGIKVDCSTLPDQNGEVILQEAAAELKAATKMNFTWVHIESWSVSAHHIALK